MDLDAGSLPKNGLTLELSQKERRVAGRRSPESSPFSETELVGSCKEGCVSVYELLYESHGARMKSLALNMLGSVPDAEDAVQETFVRIYRNVGSFKGEAAFTTWIYRILVNACHDIMRGRRRRIAEVRDPEISSGTFDFPAPAASDHPLRMTLERCLQRLEERRRTVFLLFEVEGFKHREIADILSIPEGTSKNLLFEAKKELQHCLTESRSGRSSRAD